MIARIVGKMKTSHRSGYLLHSKKATGDESWFVCCWLCAQSRCSSWMWRVLFQSTLNTITRPWMKHIPRLSWRIFHSILTSNHSALEFASFFLSPVVGIFLERIGRKNSIITGFITMVSYFSLYLLQSASDIYLLSFFGYLPKGK